MRALNSLPLRAPRYWLFAVVFVVGGLASWAVSDFRSGWLNIVLTIMWSLYAFTAVIDLLGYARAKKEIGQQIPISIPYNQARIVALVPTRGDQMNVESLRHVVESIAHSLRHVFTDYLVAIVTEHDATGLAEIQQMASNHVQVWVRPDGWNTPNGTRFKARGNVFALECVRSLGLIGPDTWLWHFDDDTGIRADSAVAVAQFIDKQIQAGANGKLLAQGVLTYPRQFGRSLLVWLADAIRSGDDLARFAFFTGGGNPLAGVHGEHLLIRSDIESCIGWDFGPNEKTEDARFALHFSTMFPGRSGWIAGRCYGASPANQADFRAQRRRWSQGLIRLAFNRSIPLSRRLLIIPTTVLWVTSLAQTVMIVIPVAFLLGGGSTSPFTPWAILPWAMGMAGTIAKYQEGLRANAHASGLNRPKLAWTIGAVVLLPVFAVMEASAAGLGLIRVIRELTSNKQYGFEVIQKTTTPEPAAAAA